jgi:predicted kinase
MSPEDVAFQRLRQRARSKNEPSDGRWEIYREQRQRFEPVADDELPYWRQWDSTKDPNPFLMRLVREVMTQG